MALLFGARALPARADGDPASDVLATQSLFLPQDAGLSPQQQARLGALLASAAAAGVPIRLAVVASVSDLGSVTELWRRPREYADFLDAELGAVYRGPLLVVMPDGVALAGRVAPAARRSDLGVLRPGQAGLGETAVAAVRDVAAASGHPLALPAAPRATRTSAGSILPWMVFALGALLVAGAWSLSLRARPPSLGQRRVPAP